MSIRFCPKCGNMLTPTEKNTAKGKSLVYECQNESCAENVEDNYQDGDKPNKENNLVYRNEIKLGQTEVKLNNDIINDPTYSRNTENSCPKCHFQETIFFQNPNINDDKMKFMFYCCNKNDVNNSGKPCGYHWFKVGKEEKKENN